MKRLFALGLVWCALLLPRDWTPVALAGGNAARNMSGIYMVHGESEDPTVAEPPSPNVHRGTLAAIRLVPQ